MAVKYQPALDGLRALAIAAVMAFHFKRDLAPGGSLGVDVFFVLSGWLITGSLLREVEGTGRVAWAKFFGNRLLRLVPPLLALLVAYVLLAPVLIPSAAPGRWVDAAVSIGFVSNLRETLWPRNTPLSHLWFLGLQVQFYALWPPILTALSRLGRERAAAVLLVAWAVLTAARVAWHLLLGGPAPYYFTPLHASGLVLGAALALRPVRLRLGWPALAALVGMFLFDRTGASFLWTEPFAEAATVLLIVDPPRPLAWPPLPFLGRISYGVYLWHVPFMWLTTDRGWPTLGVLTAASLLAGWMSYRFVESPFGRSRKLKAPAAT